MEFKVVPPSAVPQSKLDPGTIDPYKELLAREFEQILDHRGRFAEHAYGITNAWVGFLIVITISQFTLKKFGFGLDYREFVVVFTTTTAAVFGFGLLVGNFLFKNNEKQNLK